MSQQPNVVQMGGLQGVQSLSWEVPSLGWGLRP